MTCIIGLEHEGKVYIGGDSAISDFYETRTYNQDKVFRVDNILFGFAGSPRIAQIIKYHLQMGMKNEYKDDLTFMVKVLIENMRETLAVHGYDEKKMDIDGSSCIVGYNGKLYTIYSDYQVYTVADGLLSIGSGSSYALGAMHVLQDLAPKQRILKSLQASAYFSTTVDKPFKVMSL